VGTAALAEVIGDMRFMILVATAIVCCFGITRYLLGRIAYPDRPWPYWCAPLLAGGIAVVIGFLLAAHPVLLFVPIVLFFLVCRKNKEC
jgi:hypothetical protein